MLGFLGGGELGLRPSNQESGKRSAGGRLTNMRGQEKNGEQERGSPPDHTPEADLSQPRPAGPGVSCCGSECSACSAQWTSVLGRKRK